MNLHQYWFMMLTHYKRNADNLPKRKVLSTEDDVMMALFNARNKPPE